MYGRLWAIGAVVLSTTTSPPVTTVDVKSPFLSYLGVPTMRIIPTESEKAKKIKRNYVHNKKNNNYLLLILIFFFYLLRPIGNNCIFSTLLYFITMWPMISPCIDLCYNIIVVVVPFGCVNICDQDSTRQRITN